jgi:hypothetical protein
MEHKVKLTFLGPSAQISIICGFRVAIFSGYRLGMFCSCHRDGAGSLTEAEKEC